jgi:ATP-dependent DNA helicase RecG
VINADALAAEMAAFSNCEGGQILIGVQDNGELTGLSMSDVAKGLLPYHGLGSGIQRALDVWPQIAFTDDRDGCLFTATVHRRPVSEPKPVKTTPTTSGKTSGKIISALKQDCYLTIPEMASLINVTQRSIERNIKTLQDQGRLRRVGPAKGGHWEVIE